MAIKPLEQRLASILPEDQEPVDSNALLPQEPAEIGDSDAVEPVQVAGALSGLKGILQTGKATFEEGRVAREAAEASKAADAVPTAEPPGVTGAPKATPLPQDPTQPTTAGDIRKLETQMGVIETTIEAAPTTGRPPFRKMNLDKIEGPGDFKQTVDALAESSGIKIKRKTWEQSIAAAKKKGFSADLLGDLEQLGKQYGELPEDLVRLRLASYKNTQDFYDLARRSYLNPGDANLRAELLYRLNLQNSINQAYITTRTSAAQATAAGNIMVTPSMAKGILAGTEGVNIPAVNSKEMADMLADPNVEQGLKQLVEKFVLLTEDGAKEGLLNKVSKTGLWMDFWDRTYKNGLLSGLGTHVVNLTSSTTFLASSIATRALAGGIGTVRRSLGGQANIELGETGAMIAGVIHSSREAFSLALQAIKTGTTREMRQGQELLSDAGMRLEGQYNFFDARQYGYENEAFIKGINGFAGFASLLGGRPIMAMDEIFKTWGYRAELYAQAHRAGMQAERAAIDAGKSADEAKQAGLVRQGEILGNPPDEIDELSRDFGHMITFSRKLTGASARVQELAQDHLVGRIVLPFVKTPIWVGSESLQHSAFAPLSKQWRQDFQAGGSKRELAVAKWGLGSMLMMGVGSYVADGRITGGGPGDTNLRKIYLDSGWKPYSFVFHEGEWDQEFVSYLRGVRIDPSIGKDGKLYVPFRGIDPIAGPMAMMADAVEYARYEDDQDLTGQVILGAAWGLYGYVGQLPFLQGISSIAGAFSATVPNPKHAFKSAIDSIIGAGTSYAIEGSPVGVFSGARAMVERGVDPTRRMTAESPNMPTGLKGFYEALNRSIARTPFLSDSLPAQYDYLGQEMTDVDPAAPWLASTTGVRFSTTKQRPADKVMIAIGLPIKKPDMSIEAGGVNIKLEVDEYAHLMRTLGRLRDGNNDTVADAIWRRYSQAGFQAEPLSVQRDNIRDVYQGFTRAAQGELLTQSKFSPAIQRRIEAAQRKALRR
jgi:hypothetical protein